MSDNKSKILAGIEEVINSHLFADGMLSDFRYLQKRSCNELSRNPPKSFDGKALVTALFERIQENLAVRPNGRAPSSQNWRLRSTNVHHLIGPAIHNESAEVKLERAIVQKWPTNWTYQMPVASGLFDGHTDKRRAVDLVFDHEDRHYDLVELKIKSDTPLYAAMEILGYGLVYLASRTDLTGNFNYKASDLPVLKAKKITLCVLAPENYYEASNLKWLEVAINDGLMQFATPDLSIDFQFQKFGNQLGNQLPIKVLPETLIREPAW